MKKLFAYAAIVAAMSLTACTGNKANTTEEESLTPEEVAAINETVESVQEDVNAIIQAGDVNEDVLKVVSNEIDELIDALKVKCPEEEAATTAEAQAAAINALVEEIKSKGNISEVMESIQADLKAISETGDLNLGVLQGVKNKIGALNSYFGSLEADAEAAKDAAVDAAEAKVDEVKAKANEAVEDAKAKANEAVEEGKAKANEAVQGAADKANKAASDAINDAASKLKL